MTWRELFRRAWLVLRLRFKRFHVCAECGDVMRDIGMPHDQHWTCDSCEEFARLEGERQRRQQIAALYWAPGDDIAALQSYTPAIDPAALQNQIGAPIRVSQPDAIINLGSAIGSAIGYRRPSGFIW